MSDDRVERLLDAVHHAARRAAFDDLAALMPEAEACLIGLAPSVAPETLARLQQKAQRNAQCLLAMGRGIRSARQRVAELARARSGLATYDEAGRRADLPEGPMGTWRV